MPRGKNAAKIPGVCALGHYTGAQVTARKAGRDRKDTQFMNTQVAIQTLVPTETGATYRVHDLSLAEWGRR